MLAFSIYNFVCFNRGYEGRRGPKRPSQKKINHQVDNKYGKKGLHPSLDNRYDNGVPDLRGFASDGDDIPMGDKE